MFAVVFEVRPRVGAMDDYLGHAAVLRPELLGIDGFLSNERFACRDGSGWLVSLSVWRDEKALIRWRTHALHHAIQGKGRSSVFADYHLRVGEVVGEFPEHRFDVTEAAMKFLTITEGAVEGFESITRPGHGLCLQSWPDLLAAEAFVAERPGRHRVVRVIRDYGMFVRDEAPQYFPP